MNSISNYGYMVKQYSCLPQRRSNDHEYLLPNCPNLSTKLECIAVV